MAEEGGVTVCVRVRPLIERETADLDEKGQIFWKSEECTISQLDGTKFFAFDRVFHAGDSTAEVYAGVVAPIIKSAVQGYNGTIFAYGQTASGKTYTMLGTEGCPGILQMAINDVFNTICKIPDREFLLRISYMEIHNETIQDLLCSNIRKKKPLVVREDINRTIYVEDLNEEVVIAPEQVLSWLKKGEKNRHYGETKMNERSSRSHTIFRMIIESKEKTDASSSSCEGAVMVSHLNLVDLAGSERASQTGAEGIRLKEGCNINRSLFILGQVIKRLSDEQFGSGFINYRDSKLTRILQNSLGGNAKTVIICTVTPASLEETLSTLQFASTAKKMKNTPKVNEVLDDDALLKRYRKEIEDLKRRLEEVSSHSHLAQILEEKNSLQKEQELKIRTLTEILVTASSFSQEQELKTRRKRRVTWAPGAISQEGEKRFLEEIPERPKKFKASLSSLGEMEEAESSVYENSMGASAVIPEEEWVPGSEISMIHRDFADSVLLCETLVEERDNACAKQKDMQTELEKLQLEKEQLAFELRELQEKMATDEFVALEKETVKEQEMQLMHEISNLKNVIRNAEVYNQDLQEEIYLKDLQLKEQENKIKVLEDQADELKSFMEELKTENQKKDISFPQLSSDMQDEIQQMRQSLSDAEVVALDAKREASFLRSENLALKEKMNQLLDTYNKTEKDVESYRSQLEAGKATYKKMRSDLEKELQYFMGENAKLSSLLDGKVPKDLLSRVELERKMVDLEAELNKALEENTALRKDATVSLEPGFGPDYELLQKEIVEKSEDNTLLTSEKEALLSQVAEKEQMLHEMTAELQSRADFINAEAMREKDTDFQELKRQYEELNQKFMIAAEENKQMKIQIDHISDENLRLTATICSINQELSSKAEALQEKDLEHSMKEEFDKVQKIKEMEQLKDELKAWESKLKDEETEKLAIAQRLQDSEGEIRALKQEIGDLEQKQEALEHERDQIKEDIQETVTMNIESQEQLRNANHSLKQCQVHIKELEEALAEKESQISGVKETLEITIEEQKQQILKLTEDLDHSGRGKHQLAEERLEEIMEEEKKNLQLIKEQILSLEQEKAALEQQLKHLCKHKNCCLESNQQLVSEIQDLQSNNKEEDELCVKEQILTSLGEVEQLKEQLKTCESRLKAETVDKMAIVQQLHEHEEAMRKIVKERDDLREQWDSLQIKKDLTEIQVDAGVIQKHNDHEEAMRMLIQERDDLQDRNIAFQTEMDRVKGEVEAVVAQKLCEHEDAMRAVIQERDDLKDRNNALQTEMDQVREEIDAEVAQKLYEHEEVLRTMIQERDNLRERNDTLQIEMEHIRKETEAALAQKLCEHEEAMIALIQERDELRNRFGILQIEEDRIRGESETEVAQKLHEQEEAVRAVIQERDNLRERNDALQREIDQVRKEAEAELSQKLHEQEVAMGIVIQEKNYLKERQDALQAEIDQIKREIEGDLSLKFHEEEEDRRAVIQERESLREKNDALQTEIDQIRKQTDAAVAQKLCEQEEAMTMLIQERDNLREERDALQIEKDQIKAQIEAEVVQKLCEQEEAVRMLIQERDNLRERNDALQIEMDQVRKQIETEVAQKLCEHEEAMRTLIRERDNLEEKQNALEIQMEQIKGETEANITQKCCEQEEALRAMIQERDNLRERNDALQIEMDQIRKETEAEVAQKLCEHEEAMRTVIQDRDNLKEKQIALQTEMDQIRGQIDTEVALKLDEQEKVMRAVIQERDNLRERENALQVEVEHIRKETEAAIALRLHEQEEAKIVLIQERDELKDRLHALQVEKGQARGETESEVAQKLREQEEAIRVLIQEKDDLRNRQDALQIERDQRKTEMQAIESMLSHKVQEKEEELLAIKVQLCEAQQKLSVMKELQEELKAKGSELEAEKIKHLELAQRLCDSEEDRKSLSQEKDDLKQKWESLQTEKESLEKFLEENLSKVNKQLEEKSLELKRLLELREEQYQEDTKRFNEVEQLKVTAESKLKATEKEKTELFQKLHNTTEDLRSLTQEKEKLKMVVEALQSEKDNMIQTINRLSETVEKTVAANLELQEDLRNNKGLSGITDLSERKIVDDDSQATDPLQDIPARPVEQLKEETVLAKFLMLEKRSENLKMIALNLKNELSNQKAFVAKWLVNLPSQQANNVKSLQMEHALISDSLHSLVNKFQFIFCRLCKKKSEYYTNIGKYTAELLEEKKKQSELLTQIQCLKPHLEQRGALSQQLSVADLSQNLDFYEKQTLKDISEMEEELLNVEIKLQQMESDGEKAKQYLERCAVHFELQDFEEGIKQDNARLMSVGRFLKPRSQDLIQAKSQLETKNSNYCRETEAVLKTCREQTEELLLELNVLQKEQTLGRGSNCALEEENYKLQNKLKDKEQELKILKQKIQELGNEMKEAELKLQEKEKKIAVLEMELKVRASKSEVVKLHAILEEKENCLTTALTEKQALKVQLDKGAELYQEEIEDLKTQLAKAEMARMKQSKYFDQEMVNAKALAEHREEQLRKLREELRRAQHEKDVTITLPKDHSQPPLPITCGGGSGIVQSTQMLVLKNEHAKLGSEYNQLKKQYELLSKNELALKEEVKKWKERALKRKEQPPKVPSKEQRLETPRRTAPASFPELPPSLYNETSVQPVLPPATPPSAQSNFIGFFDNSHFGLHTDAKGAGTDTGSTGAEATENDLELWMTRTKKDNSNCKTQ